MGRTQPGGALRGQEIRPGTSATNPGGTYRALIAALRAMARKSSFGSGNRAGPGSWGFISIYKICFLGPAGCTWVITASSLFFECLKYFIITFKQQQKSKDKHKGKGEETVPRVGPHRW